MAPFNSARFSHGRLSRVGQAPPQRHKSLVRQSLPFLILFFVLGVAFLPVCRARAAGAGTGPRRLATGQAAACLSFSPDGKTLAVGGDRLQIFDVATGHRRFDQVSRHGTVLSLAFSPDSATLASGVEDAAASTSRIELREGQTGRLRRAFKAFGPHETPASYLAFSPDGKSLAGEGGSENSSDGYLRLWQVRTGRLLMGVWLQKFTPPLFLPDGKTLVTLNHRDGVRLLSAQTGQIVGVLPCRLDLQRVALSHDGSFLALAGHDHIFHPFSTPEHHIEIWDVRSRTRRRVLGGNLSDLDDMRFSPDGRLLTVGGRLLENAACSRSAGRGGGEPRAAPSVARIWDISSGTPSRPLALGGASFDICAFSPDGHFLAVATIDSVHLWPVR